MAKLDLNTALNGIHGRIDNWVYRRVGDRMILGRRPERSGPPSPAQLAFRERFLEAAAYARAALADPVRQLLYRAAARIKVMSPAAIAVGDYLNLPQVKAIDTTDYHGHIGDPVKVTALDDFEVVGVNVVIRNGAALVEQGSAVLTDGLWTYATTVAVAAGQNVTIEAVAKDRPGHTGSLVKPWLIA